MSFEMLCILTDSQKDSVGFNVRGVDLQLVDIR